MSVVLLYDHKLMQRWPSQRRTFLAINEYATMSVDVNDPSTYSRLMGNDVLSFGWFRFCSYLNQLGEAMQTCKRLIQVVTDYEHPPVTQIRRAIEGKPNVAISNMDAPPPGKTWSWARDWIYLNWNLLAWIGVQPNVQSALIPGLLYYGRWRNKRAPYFEKFMGWNCGYRVNVSTGPRVVEKFQDMNPAIVDFPRFDTLEELQRFWLSVYIEDTFTHSHYNSPANRFYECLAWGIPQVFDESCVNTFDRAGIEIRPWIADRARVADMIEAFTDPVCRQRALQLQRQSWIPLSGNRSWRNEFLDNKKDVFEGVLR